MSFLDNCSQSLCFFREIRRLVRFDADGILCEQLLLCGFELALTAKLRKATGDSLR
jgi:hypothetical protein